MAACTTMFNGTEGRTILPTYNETAPYSGLTSLRDSLSEEDVRGRAISALEKKGYYWRAIDSMARETGFQENEIRAMLKNLIKKEL